MLDQDPRATLRGLPILQAAGSVRRMTQLLIQHLRGYRSLRRYVMYETLPERHRSPGNVFKIERTLCVTHYQPGKKRHSFVPGIAGLCPGPSRIRTRISTEWCASTRVEPKAVGFLFRTSALTCAEVSRRGQTSLARERRCPRQLGHAHDRREAGQLPFVRSARAVQLPSSAADDCADVGASGSARRGTRRRLALIEDQSYRRTALL